MFLAPIYIAMTFIRTWRIRTFRARLLEFLNGDTSVAFCKVPENAPETPTLSSKLCTNPNNAHLCDLYDYTNATRVCSMKPNQSINLKDWISCAGGLPLGTKEAEHENEDINILLECECEPDEANEVSIFPLCEIGNPVAWKAGTHLAIILKTNIETLSIVGFNFVNGEFMVEHELPVVRIQTVSISGEANKANDPSMRSLRSDIQHNLKKPPTQFQWPVHVALLRKLSKVVDIKCESRFEMNGSGLLCNDSSSLSRKNVSLTDVSVNTVESILSTEVLPIKSSDIGEASHSVNPSPRIPTTPVKEKENIQLQPHTEKLIVSNDNVSVEIQHNITPKKSSLKLDLKKSTQQLSSSLQSISSHIKSVTSHKKTLIGRKKSHADEKIIEEPKSLEHVKDSPMKSLKESRPLVNTKSPNVLIYSDSVVTQDNLKASLEKVLDSQRYTIYGVSRDALEGGAWRGQAALVAVAGALGPRGAALLLAHLLDGGKLLALCSDLLHTVLPYYKTAEVREHEVVQFSYEKWQSVRMKHHIFCYQASPAKKQFSTETDRQPSKYTGHPGHELDIKILATEETWRTPSLILTSAKDTNGIAIFSQIHLEADPTEYLGSEGASSNDARLQILHKILGELLGLHVREDTCSSQLQYTKGYFLGNHLHKMAVVERLCPAGAGDSERISQLGAVQVQWCERNEQGRPPHSHFLPVCVHTCPENFSTVDYFDNLTSETVGRLVVYADVMRSTQDLLEGARVAHGLCVVARTLTAGRGRAGNTWIAPEGCACVSTQIWSKMSPSVSLYQHAGALAVVRAVRTLPGYDQLDLRIKWPNDVYYGREAKVGGVMAKADVHGDEVVVNIGTGVNVSNAKPTTCVNAVIAAYNASHGTHLPPLSVERFLARYCSQLDHLLQVLEQDGGVGAFVEHYYTYWLHDGEKVQVTVEGKSSPVPGEVAGIDEAGFLLVKTQDSVLHVQPDGNTFDMLRGLIAPKIAPNSVAKQL